MTDITRDALLTVLRRDLRGLNIVAARRWLKQFVDVGVITTQDIEELHKKGVFIS
jgi:hypothetical protein